MLGSPQELKAGKLKIAGNAKLRLQPPPGKPENMHMSHRIENDVQVTDDPVWLRRHGAPNKLTRAHARGKMFKLSEEGCCGSPLD